MWESLPAEEFIAMISDPKVLGNPLLKTQHLVGVTRWERVSDTKVIGYHQMRVAHQKYASALLHEVVIKGHTHSSNKHLYQKADGVWKLAGLKSDIRWAEYNFDKVFAEGREDYGDKKVLSQSAVI